MTTPMPHSVSLQTTDRLFIGGEWIEPSTSARIDVVDPTTEEILFSVAEAREKDIDRAVGAARHAFDHGPWPRMRHAERAEVLRRIAVGLDSTRRRDRGHLDRADGRLACAGDLEHSSVRRPVPVLRRPCRPIPIRGAPRCLGGRAGHVGTGTGRESSVRSSPGTGRCS